MKLGFATMWRRWPLSSIWVRLIIFAIVAGVALLAYQSIGQMIRKAEVEKCVEARLAACLADLAEQLATDYTDAEFRSDVAKNLAIAGKFETARRLVEQGLSEPTQKDFAELELAVAATAAFARANPDRPAPLDRLERLPEISVYRYPSVHGLLISAYGILATELAGARPNDIGSTRSINNAIQAARAKRPAIRSQTLEAVLQRLAQLAAAVPVMEQRWRYTDLGVALAEAKESERARDAFAKARNAPQYGNSNFKLMRGWLRVQAFTEALALAKLFGDFQAQNLTEVATALLQENRPDEARDVLDLAWQAAVSAPIESRKFETLQRIVGLTLEAADRPRALLRAEEMLRLVSGGALMREFALAFTATAFNELGQSARAREVLAQIAVSFPPSDTSGFEFFRGRLSYQGFKDVADDLLVHIATETYLAGDTRGALDLLKRVSFLHKRHRAWGYILNSRLDCAQIKQNVEQLVRFAGEEATLGLLIGAGATCMERGALGAAAGALEEAVRAATVTDLGAKITMRLDLARLADAAGRTDLARKALMLAASDAIQSRSRNFAQGAKWNFCLTAGTLCLR
ncbi:MAG: hypothetical protein K2Z80_25545, partial [Xanthobacteraceae bacterium]|nr:hypothetical protein [Xanthobacteraceae bacterium]